MDIRLKRIYDKPANRDGHRVLIDRLWPRGIKKDDARLDDWAKDIAPSDELRKWFDHDPNKWPAFKKKYAAQLKGQHEALKAIVKAVPSNTLTLLYAAKDEKHNHAIVLQAYLQDHIDKDG